MTQPILAVRALTKRFGGVNAVDNVHLTIVTPGIHSLIGPNGAGKTTLFNLISGIYLPTSGTVEFEGRSIVDVPPNVLAARGISRTFQNLQIFSAMTALENVMVGAHLRQSPRLLASMLRLAALRRSDREVEAIATDLLRFVGVFGYRDRVAGQMPFGALKRLEIARALAASPRLLLLDEPAAGLNQTEKAELQNLIRRVADDGVTVLLVEHDMKLVMDLSDNIVVLANGRKLAEGGAEAVRTNPDVLTAYLGAPARVSAHA
jgi:branched-chain amino acid transport system ATP-binding protein